MVERSDAAPLRWAGRSRAGSRHVDVNLTGHVPHGWHLTRLGDLCDPPEYGANAPARPFDPNLPRYVRITDLTDDGQLRTGDARSADPRRTLGFELTTGDLLFARSGATAGKTYLYREEDGPCVYAGYLIRFRPHSTKVLPGFVELWTRSTFYRRWLRSVSRIGAQPNINASEYASLPILVPPLAEQETIVRMLDSIEEVIESTEAVLVSLKQLHHSLQNQLLARGVPGWHSKWQELPALGTIPAEWQVVKLDDIADIVGGSTPSRATETFWGGTISWVVPSEITNLSGRYLTSTKQTISEAGLKSAGLRILPSKSILLTSRATLGEAAINTIPVTTNQGFQNVVVKHGADYLWLYYWLTAMRQEFERRASGSTFREVSRDSVRSLPVLLPPLPEQRVIANTLDSIDESTESTEQLLGTLRSLRLSMSEALLLGKLQASHLTKDLV